MATCPLPSATIPAPPKPEQVLSFLDGTFDVRLREWYCWVSKAEGKAMPAAAGTCGDISFGRTPSGRWKRTVKLTKSPALEAKIVSKFGHWSGKAFAESMADGMLKSRRSWTMAKVLADPAVKKAWRVDYGQLHAPIRPKPTETLAEFQARKGYLLWVNADGALQGQIPVGKITKTDGSDFYLFATYLPGTHEVTFSIAYRAAGMAERMYEGIKDLPGTLVSIGKILVKTLCDKVFTRDELLTIVQTANAVAGTVPAPAQAAAQAWMATGSLCNIVWPACTPADIPAPPATFEPPWWQQRWVLYAAGGLAALVGVGVTVKVVRSKKS